MNSCTGSVMALSAGYLYRRILHTVETTSRLVAIALCEHPRACLCLTTRQLRLSLYGLDLCGAIVEFTLPLCLNLNAQLRFLTCKMGKDSEITVPGKESFLASTPPHPTWPTTVWLPYGLILSCKGVLTFCRESSL